MQRGPPGTFRLAGNVHSPEISAHSRPHGTLTRVAGTLLPGLDVQRNDNSAHETVRGTFPVSSYALGGPEFAHRRRGGVHRSGGLTPPEPPSQEAPGYSRQYFQPSSGRLAIGDATRSFLAAPRSRCSYRKAIRRCRPSTRRAPLPAPLCGRQREIRISRSLMTGGELQQPIARARRQCLRAPAPRGAAAACRRIR